MNYRPNGIKFADPKILPANWNNGGKTIIKADWRIEYRFYDPAFHSQYPKGKRIRVKGGMNEEKSLDVRRELAKQLLKNEFDLLLNQGYNPITNTINPPKPEADKGPIYPEMPVCKALAAVLKHKDCTKGMREGLTNVIKWATAAIKNLELADIEIGNFKRKHVKMVLDEIGRLKKDKWTANNFNFYRAYLSTIWMELVEYEAVEYNIIREIRKKPKLIQLREVLTADERAKVDAHLRERKYRFWLYTNIFFHSGSRKTELAELRGKDVNLAEMTYKVTVKKGQQKKVILKPIKAVALNFWEQAMIGCGPDDYVFSRGFKPGKLYMGSEWPTRYWKELVKDELGINKDFYSLKHLNTDEIDTMLSIEDAARLNGHTTTRMTLERYAVGHNSRQMERIRNVGNTLGGGLE